MRGPTSFLQLDKARTQCIDDMIDLLFGNNERRQTGIIFQGRVITPMRIMIALIFLATFVSFGKQVFIFFQPPALRHNTIHIRLEHHRRLDAALHQKTRDCRAREKPVSMRLPSYSACATPRIAGDQLHGSGDSLSNLVPAVPDRIQSLARHKIEKRLPLSLKTQHP